MPALKGQLQAEKERSQAAEERVEAEKERNQAAEERVEAAEERNRPSTFMEMLDLYHRLTSKPLKVQNIAQSTQGTYTKPTGRYFPTKLLPWTDFLSSQQERFENRGNILPTQRLFPPSLAIDHVRKMSCGPLSSEQGVRTYTWIAVESIVGDIIAQLLEIDDAKASFNLEGRVNFESHLGSLNELDSEVRETTARKARPKERAYIPVDQYSIVERADYNDDDTIKTTLRDILFLIEYKAAHKLTAETLRRVLGKGDFDIRKLINVAKYPTDDEGHDLYRSEMEAAAAISQLFGYMVRAGTEYGYITTGRSFLFLRVKEHEPATAYYHIDVNEEAIGCNLSCTSIGQVLCFSLLALKSRPRD